MKEMLKNKGIILFVVLVLGITFVSSYNTKLESERVTQNTYLAIN